MNGRTRVDLPAEQALPIIVQTALGFMRKYGISCGDALKRTQHELGVRVASEHIPAIEAQVKLMMTRDLMVQSIDGYLKAGKPARDAILQAIRDLGIVIPEDRVEGLIAFYDREIARLREELDKGNHVAGGQVVEVMRDDDYAKEHGHG